MFVIKLTWEQFKSADNLKQLKMKLQAVYLDGVTCKQHVEFWDFFLLLFVQAQMDDVRK